MKNNRPNHWLFKTVPIFIGTVFVLIVLFYIALGIVGSEITEALDDCTPAVITDTRDGTAETSIGCKQHD